MKPDWLIQTNMEGIDTDPMIAEVLTQGMTVREIEHRLGSHVDFSGYDPHDCIICYGDIDFVRQVNTRAPFIPGAWCNFDNMKCNTYYAYLGEHLLNQQYMMMPIGDLIRRWEDLRFISTLSNQGHSYIQPTFSGNVKMRRPCTSLFVRPNSGTKLFTGFVVEHDEKHKIESMVQSIGLETLIIIAPVKNITAEWRFVICDRKVVTGCQYLPTESPTFLPSSLRLARIIATQEWQPDLCYTVDIAESEGEVYLLEINSFSCAGFYDCNIASIVQYASKAAFGEWKEYCDPQGVITPD